MSFHDISVVSMTSWQQQTNYKKKIFILFQVESSGGRSDGFTVYICTVYPHRLKNILFGNKNAVFIVVGKNDEISLYYCGALVFVCDENKGLIGIATFYFNGELIS